MSANDNDIVTLQLNRGTKVKITSFGNIREAGDNALMSIDYTIVTKGHLSRWQIRKTVARWVMNALWQGAAHDCVDSRQKTVVLNKASRGRRWNEKHACHLRALTAE